VEAAGLIWNHLKPPTGICNNLDASGLTWAFWNHLDAPRVQPRATQEAPREQGTSRRDPGDTDKGSRDTKDTDL